MIIGIIGAMIEEVTPLVEFFKNQGYKIEEIALGGNVFHKIIIQNDTLYIAYSKIGKVHAAITASVMIARFECKRIVFTGVAGGLDARLKVGDLLIATKLAQHDVDITAFGHPLGFIPESAVYIEADSALNAIAKKVAQKLNKPLMEGIIASGDQFICDESKKQWIIQNFQASAVEMEGASVAVVCNAFKIPFCILRSISDSADGSADVSFDEFLEEAARVSAQFSIEILKELGVKI